MAEYKRSRAIVEERSGGRCEVELADVCTGMLEQTHHRQPRSRGGGEDPANLLGLCRACHQWIHEHPTAATLRGLLVSWHPDPPAEPEPEVEPAYRCVRCESPMDPLQRMQSEQSPHPGHCSTCSAALVAATAPPDQLHPRIPDPF